MIHTKCTSLMCISWGFGFGYANTCDAITTNNIPHISFTSKNVLVSECVCTCLCVMVRTLDMKSILFYSAQHHIVNYSYYVLQHISGTYSFCLTETLYTWINHSPFPHDPNPWQLLCYSLLLWVKTYVNCCWNLQHLLQWQISGAEVAWPPCEQVMPNRMI